WVPMEFMPPRRSEGTPSEIRRERKFPNPVGLVPGASDVPPRPAAPGYEGPAIALRSRGNQEPPPQPMRGPAPNDRCPVAKIGDAGKEEIAGAIEEVERKIRQQKKAHSNRCTSRAS